MNKLYLVAVFTALAVMVAAPAGASPIAEGYNYANLLDWGSDFDNSGGRPDAQVSTGPGRNIGDEQRTIFYCESLWHNPDEIKQPGDSGTKKYNYGQSPEFTGLVYDLEVVDIVGGFDGTYAFNDYYLAGADSWTDYSDGRMDVYADPANDQDSTNGPGLWNAIGAGGAIGDPTLNRDTYPTFSNGAMQLSLTFVPFMVHNKRDIVMIQRFWEPAAASHRISQTVGYAYADILWTAGPDYRTINWNDGSGISSHARFKAQYVAPGTGGWAANSEDPLEFYQEPVPEPATMALLGTSLLGLIPAIRRRRRK